MSTMTPQPNLACPLCGQPNECAVARCGRFDVDCWCSTARIDPRSLALVPPAQRGLACVCRRCAAQPPSGDMLDPSEPPGEHPTTKGDSP
jgi:hypothetical protein